MGFSKWVLQHLWLELVAITILSLLALIIGCGAKQYSVETSIEPANGGTIAVSGQSPYNAGTTINLTANAASGYRFDHWSGDTSGNSNPVSLMMDNQKTITAHFKLQYKLNTSSNPLEGGTVTPAQGVFDEGSQVSFNASPAPGYRFDSWSGDISGTTPDIIVNVDKEKNIVANFKLQHQLSTSVSPPEGGSVTPAQGFFEEGSQSVVTASPAPGYRFDSWSGDISDTSPAIAIAFDDDKNLVANFKAQYQLNTTRSPDVGGSVTPSQGVYDAGSQVLLKATPSRGFRFDRWGGETEGVFSSTTITMNGRKTVIAYFMKQYDLSLKTSPPGSGSLSLPSGPYDAGTTIKVSANPARGWEFDYWISPEGKSVKEPVIEFTLNSDSQVEAVFKEAYTDLIVAQTQGLVAVKANGHDLDHIILSLTSTTDKNIDITVKPGTIFRARYGAFSKMIVTIPYRTTVYTGGTTSAQISVACQSVDLEMPRDPDFLEMESELVSGDMLTLVNSPLFQSKSMRVRQFAVWTINDNPARDRYPLLGDMTKSVGSYTGPMDEEINEIKVLLETLGISTTKYKALRE